MPSLKDDLEDILSCSICLERLTEPKLLPCSHRFCKTCLRQEIDRSATSGPASSFPCPLCKRTVYLQRGRQGKERIDCFETDRLLKDVLERLGGVTEGLPDVCIPHKKELEIVCHECQETGCLQCAWDKHRHCTNVRCFMEVTEKTELDLRQLHLKIGNHIQTIKAHLRKLISVKKSFENQISYSNKFVDHFIEDKRNRFKSNYEHLVESYSRKTIPTNLQKDINELMQNFLAKLTIDTKCEQELSRLKKRNLQFCETVCKISLEIDSIPGTQQLTTAKQDIDRTLQLDKGAMVLVGGNLLAELEEKLYDQLHKDLTVEFSCPELKGLITRDEQIDLDIKEEENLLAVLKGILDTADDPRKLLEDLEKHCFSQKPTVDPRDNVQLVPANLKDIPFHGRRHFRGREKQDHRTNSSSETNIGGTLLPHERNVRKQSVKEQIASACLTIVVAILFSDAFTSLQNITELGFAFFVVGFLLLTWILYMLIGAIALVAQLKPKKEKEKKKKKKKKKKRRQLWTMINF